MKELEDTHCEVRKIVELQFANWEYQNNPSDDDARPLHGSPEPNEDTNFMGGFLNDINYAWLSYGSKLVVFNTKTGVSISTWIFRERVSCISQFPAQPGQIPLLLVGLDNDANKIKDSYGMICIFDCTISQVVRAIRMPAGVEQLCIVNGGAEWEEINNVRMDNILEESHGTACVALRNLDHYIVDLRRNSWENMINLPLLDESNAAEIEMADTGNTSTRFKPNRETHSVHNLMNDRLERYIGFNRAEFESTTLCQEKMTTSMICTHKIACLISGCLGRIIIWQSDGVVRWISPPMDDNMSVTHLALLEPTDDPRPFCYLWVAYQEDAPSTTQPNLRMYAMLFERKYLDKDMNCYFNLEGEPSLKFEFEIEDKSRITSLYPIVRENKQEQTESDSKKGEDNLLLINIEGKTILFDLNQWYKEQMPRFIRECQNADAILSSYQSERESLRDKIISCAYIPSTLKEFPCTTSTTPEELFSPNSLSLEWIELSVKRLTFWFTRGMQGQLLRDIAMAGPIIMIQPSETYHRCISAGLIPFNSEISSNNTVDSQRDALLTLCLEQRWTVFLLKCAKEWSDGSAAYLYPAFLRWGIQRASAIQLTAHQLCIPLFDQSGTSIGEAEVKTLRFFSQQMECLCNIIENLPLETGELDKQRRSLRRISMYLQILLWFYDVGLLPETQDVDEESLLISFILKIPYPTARLATIYAEKRKQYRRNSAKKEDVEAVMFIDELIMNECPALKSQWEQESSEIHHDGHYPPPSLQSLLRSCLIDCYRSNGNEMENKHQIIIYLLMDLVMLYQGSCPGVDQLIKYPSAFKLSPSLIKLTQALWLLDHEDYQGFLEIMTGQLVLESDIKDWHHKLVMRTLLRSNQNKLALIYIRVRKPPLSSIDDQGTVIDLSVEHGLVHSAFHHRPASHYSQLLTKFFRACKHHGKLNDILHLALDNEEEEAFIQYLDEEKCEETRLVYYLQHSRYNEANDALPSDQSIVSLKKTNKPASLLMFHAYNSTLPDITRRFSTNFNRRNIDLDTESRHPRPMSHYKSRASTRDIHETVIRKARETFIKGDKSQIPFISAPCSSLKASVDSNGSNCVMFVERLRKPYTKRTLQEMEDNDLSPNNETEVRKRRKIIESDDPRSGEVGLNMMFGTPLVRKKNRMNNGTDGSSGTPHSILKIRQMIRDSMSPRRVSSSEDEKNSDTEKKLRQIRFSINQPKSLDGSVSGDPPCGINESISEDIMQLDTTESIKSRSVTPSNSADEGEEYFSPNANTKSLSETTVLTDSSSYYSKSLSGPRPRPGLRRSNNSPFDDMKKSSVRHSIMNTDSSPNSAKASVDISVTSDIVSSTFIDSHTPRVPHSRPILPSVSIYASTVLSSDTSLELSPHGTPRKCNDTRRTSNSFGMDSVESSLKNDLLSDDEVLREVNSTTPTSFARTETTTTNKVTMNIIKTDDNFSDGEINDEEETTISKNNDVTSDTCSIKVEGTNEEINVSSEPATAIQLENSTNEEHIEKDKYEGNRSQISPRTPHKSKNIEGAIDDGIISVKPSDDYDDELLALKYDDEEDDNDEVFKSLANSMERSFNKLDETSKKSPMQDDALNKSVARRFYDECNMTDDESSGSVDQSDITNMIRSQHARTNTITVETPSLALSMFDDADITDDKTDDSLDSSKFSINCVKDRNMNERPDVTTMSERLSSNRENEVISRNNEGEFVELHAAENVGPASTASIELASNIKPEVDEQTLTPVRMTRLRRASSVVLMMQESVLETAEMPQIGRTRRASSLAKETHSTPIMESCITPSGLDNSSGSPVVKKGRGRRSTSLMKEVLTTSTLNEPSLANVTESPLRRSARRATSVQKEIAVTTNTPTKNAKIIPNTSTIEENPSDESEPAKLKIRSKRATSVSKDVNVRIRKTQTISESPANNDEYAAREKSPAPRKTRAASVSKETVDHSTLRETKPRRTRAASMSKDMMEDSTTADVPRARRTRAASVSKENAEEIVPKRKRAASLASEVTPEIPSRRKRATSLTEDIVEESLAKPRRLTRASSVTKEIPVNDETTNKRPSRRKASTSKDATLETVRTRKSIIVDDIIPEEDVDESILMCENVSMTSQVVEGAIQNHSTVTRVRDIIKTVIPEEREVDDESEEVPSEISKNDGWKGKKGSLRARRATSVDLPHTEIKRRARGLTKSVSNDDHDGTEESSIIDGKNKKMRKTTVRRITRAASETKELGDSTGFQSLEEVRSSGTKKSGIDDAQAYVFSPEPKSLRPASSQTRRPIANFIAPLTDEEEKMTAEMTTDRSKNSRKPRSSFSMPRVRTKFSFPSQNNLK